MQANSNPTVSVVVPVYNGEQTIQETIESILHQTFSDFEILVINDGSNDSTLDILSKIQQPKLKVFSYPNAGLSASRNRGVRQAKGDYISFIDADDLWTEDKLEKQLKALQENPNASVAYSWTNWIDGKGNFLRSGGYIHAEGDVFLDLLKRDFVESGSNVLVKTKAILEVGDFDESLNAVEDWDMWLRLAERYSFVCVPLPQILYRVSSTSMSADVWKMEKASFRAIEKACQNTSRKITKDLKAQIFGERYRYLTIKALDGYPDRKKGLTALNFLVKAIRYDASWLKRTKLMAILVLKIAISTLLPFSSSKETLKLFKRMTGKIA
ncbi:glycosyltransferase [Geitlerinema sp. PCC 9228]|jgi:glycosyltransferase involved in cell wall biosynthesis|uniref:glycosyltransferase n=1 Tax=Geitlerinema sp. PCC 9228 TaxID=111611 RepID=UPI0008F9A752|nr:glycosyltransferase [Geitlerinema sp. PCC 9228]